MAAIELDTAQIVARVRRFGTETEDVEIKSAASGLPRSTVETVSAFANGSGGTLILGLAESNHFAPADGFDAKRILDALAGVCADRLEPALRGQITIDEVEGAPVVRLDVPELDAVQKPCFVKDRGAYQGSYIRSGDGDRRLTHYEITQLLSNRGQPDDDLQPVERAGLDDLAPDLVEGVVRRVRARNRRAFDGLSDEAALLRLGVLTQTDSGLIPTLAGLLCLGSYPQQYFPQLFISFVALPGLTLGESAPDGTRFLDNQALDGPIPLMVEDAVAAVERNMRRASVVQGVGRRDRYDYPLEVVRELVVNAVMHRDYSAGALGTQVQIELYPDRLLIKSPGGLYGSVDVAQLGTEDVSSSRNALLAKLLADVPTGGTGQVVAENRGSGLPTVVRSLRDAGMSPPEFNAQPAHLFVTVPQHALLDPATVSWIGSLNAGELQDAQHLALAMMRANGAVSNEMLRAWGVESHAATQALTDLVARGLAVKLGGRRYARYELAGRSEPPTLFAEATAVTSPTERTDTQLAAVLEAIRAGFRTSRAIQEHLGLSYATTMRRIRVLRAAGKIEETAARHSRAQSYRLTRSDSRRG